VALAGMLMLAPVALAAEPGATTSVTPAPDPAPPTSPGPAPAETVVPASPAPASPPRETRAPVPRPAESVTPAPAAAGQVDRVPVGGADTGVGGPRDGQTADPVLLVVLGGLGVAGVAGAGVLALRRTDRG
jgi:hypothetical protein